MWHTRCKAYFNVAFSAVCRPTLPLNHSDTCCAIFFSCNVQQYFTLPCHTWQILAVLYQFSQDPTLLPPIFMIWSSSAPDPRGRASLCRSSFACCRWWEKPRWRRTWEALSCVGKDVCCGSDVGYEKSARVETSITSGLYINYMSKDNKIHWACLSTLRYGIWTAPSLAVTRRQNPVTVSGGQLQWWHP